MAKSRKQRRKRGSRVNATAQHDRVAQHEGSVQQHDSSAQTVAAVDKAAKPNNNTAPNRILGIPREPLQLAALLLMVVASFLPAFSAGFIWDDNVFIVNEPQLLTLDGLANIWFRPMLMEEFHYWPVLYTSFWLEQKLWGLDYPEGFHAVNILLHAVNTVLLWRLLLRMAIPGAWLIAAVFAVHPVHVEAVAWIIARKDLLATFFYLLTALYWLRFQEQAKGRRNRKSRTTLYLLILLLYTAGTLTKSVMLTLPVVLLVWIWWQRGRITRPDLIQVAPLFAISFIIGIYDMMLFGSQAIHDFHYAWYERPIIAGKAVWFYVGKLLWPHPLMFHYPHWDVSGTNPLNWTGMLAALALVASLWLARHRIGRGPLAGVLFFGITILPVLGLVSFGYMKFSFVADRYLYLPGIGLITVLIAAAVTTWQHLLNQWNEPAKMPPNHHSPLEGESEKAKPSAVGGPTPTNLISTPAPQKHGLLILSVLGRTLMPLLLIVYGTLTFQRTKVFEDDVVMFRHVVATNPAVPDGWFNLGTVLMRREEDKLSAIEAFEKAIEQDPNVAKVYINLGSVLMQLNRYEEAEVAFNNAIELEPEDFSQERMPMRARHESAMAHINLSNVLLELERPQEAVEVSLRDALELEPDNVFAQQGLARALYRQERHQEALTLLQQIIRSMPEPTVAVYLSAGEVATAMGRTTLAAQYFQQATALEPSDATSLVQQAAAHYQAGRYEQALEFYQRGIALQPNNAQAHSNMGSALGQLGRIEEAITSFERALELNPQLESARTNLELARQRINQEQN
ncbi:MAG: tetratricopeptide repeat protein [Pseudohongiellaceae bacterium]